MPAELVSGAGCRVSQLLLVQGHQRGRPCRDVSRRSSGCVSGAVARKGQYARWLKSAGGPYDGFLLSTANVFADRLAEMIALTAGRASASGRTDHSTGAAGRSRSVWTGGATCPGETRSRTPTRPWIISWPSVPMRRPMPRLTCTTATVCRPKHSTPYADVLDRFGLIPDVGYLALA